MASYQLYIPLEPMNARRHPRRRLGWIASLLLVLATATFVSCAPSAMVKDDTGVRSDFHPTLLKEVAVLPFFSTEPFGLSETEQEKVLSFYESVARDELKKLGVEVTDTKALQSVTSVAPQDVRAGLNLTQPLDSLFETLPPERQIAPERRAFLKEYARKAGVQTVLLGQVVYHTSATCPTVVGSQYSQHVVHVGGKSAPADVSVPCAVAHFQGKLVNAETGKTIWFNRALREARAAEADGDVPDLMENARAAVGIVFQDQESGLHQVVATR